MLQPLNVLRTATKAVPALKYAVGVSGLIAIVAIVRQFGLSPQSAALGSVVVLVLMVGVFVFARLSAFTGRKVYIPAMMLLYSFTLLVILVASFLFTSAFMDWPKPLGQLFSGERTEPKKPVIAYRRTFYESFNPGSVSGDIWLIGTKDTWTGSLQNGSYILDHSSNETPVLRIRTSYREEKTGNLIDQGDCKVDLKVRVENAGHQHSAAGLLFRANRANEDENFYTFVLEAGNNVSFTIVKDNHMKILWSQEIAPPKTNEMTSLRVAGMGSRIQLYVNDTLVHTVEQAELLKGDPGVFAMYKGRFVFADYAVYLPTKS